MAENLVIEEAVMATAVRPLLRLPDASSAREAVSRWLLREVGTAAYPGEAWFLSETFNWHIPVWLSYAEKSQIGLLADIYVNAATGEFVGRPGREELIRRAEAVVAKMS